MLACIFSVLRHFFFKLNPIFKLNLCFLASVFSANILDYKTKGCLDVSKCNQTEQVNLPGKSNSTILKVTKTCCSTDLCNSAPLGHFHFSAVSMAFTTISSVFMVKILI